MKKVLIILSIVVLALTLTKKENVIIPKNSIRFRVIANSNSEQDQTVKKQLVNDLSKEINKINYYSKDISSSRKTIQNNLHNFDKIITESIKDESYKDNYNISYGINYFPEKEYKGVKYESGNYESLVIKLGSGMGDNWWCVMFPPICSLEVEENSDIEYKFFVKELFDKYI